MHSKPLAIAAPENSEHAPYYARYISLVESTDILDTLADQPHETVSLLSRFTEDHGDDRYQPEKWSVKEVLGHVIDTERIFAYRALRIARNDKTPIEGFEQDDYVPYGLFGRRSLNDLIEEFNCVRHASLLLFRNLDADAWSRRGIASENEVSVRAIAYIIAGHELHHRKILKEKYLPLAA